MELLLLVVAAYLIGSIPFGLIIGKLIWKKDLRQYGSHNIGATNAWRVLGKKAGILIFILDFLKGQIGVFLGAYCLASPGAMVLGGLFAVIGHMFPLFAAFKEPTPYFVFTLVAAIMIVLRHRENIARLKSGRENRF